jgi:hypothetical protein
MVYRSCLGCMLLKNAACHCWTLMGDVAGSISVVHGLLMQVQYRAPRSLGPARRRWQTQRQTKPTIVWAAGSCGPVQLHQRDQQDPQHSQRYLPTIVPPTQSGAVPSFASMQSKMLSYLAPLMIDITTAVLQFAPKVEILRGCVFCFSACQVLLLWFAFSGSTVLPASVILTAVRNDQAQQQRQGRSNFIELRS